MGSRKKQQEPESDAIYIYKDIRRRIRQRYNQRKEFAMHFVGWFVLCVIIGPVYGAYNAGWVLVIAVLWTVAMLVHGVETLFNEWSERAIDRQLERSGLSAIMEKAKRDEEPPMRLVTLTEDGELNELDVPSTAEQSDRR